MEAAKARCDLANDTERSIEGFTSIIFDSVYGIIVIFLLSICECVSPHTHLLLAVIVAMFTVQMLLLLFVLLYLSSILLTDIIVDFSHEVILFYMTFLGAIFCSFCLFVWRCFLHVLWVVVSCECQHRYCALVMFWCI